MRRLPVALACLAALLVAALPAAADAAPRHPLVVGIADQKDAAFADPRFRSLGLRHARRSVAWDALGHAWQVEELDRWMLATRAAGLEPLITFSRSRIASQRHVLPSPARFAAAFRAFRLRYPWARTFVAWNESNHYGEPTGRRPEKAARLYRAMVVRCPRCTILAAALLDQPNMVSWVRRFTKAAKVPPKRWGLHNYFSANRFDVRPTQRLLKAVKGEIWLTETGGLVARRNKGAKRLRQGVGHAADVTRFIFDRIVPLSPRIKRVYLYHWSATRSDRSWDSGLIGPDGRARPALGVLKRVLASRNPPR